MYHVCLRFSTFRRLLLSILQFRPSNLGSARRGQCIADVGYLPTYLHFPVATRVHTSYQYKHFLPSALIPDIERLALGRNGDVAVRNGLLSVRCTFASEALNTFLVLPARGIPFVAALNTQFSHPTLTMPNFKNVVSQHRKCIVARPGL
ncbi:hypothetical protein FPQ18DRAFT_134117 [Pyronema domesticum]|nr:hypothetical protein FPQ18DRAFT_134117 [Pyronema domesticum]